MAKRRLDVLMVERGLATDQDQAQRLIRAGTVAVGGQRADKPGHTVDVAAAVTVQAPPRYVSRGGEKLAGAFAAFPLSVHGAVCIDVGASTGGFTDCLLQTGAARVYAVDVGQGLLHWKLRNDPRVVVCEGHNARLLEPAAFEPPPTVAVVDVAFISLTKVMPATMQVMAATGLLQVVTLIKPQFEAERSEVGKGGVVRDPAVHLRVVEAVRHFGETVLGLVCVGVVESPLRGPAGNVEFLAYWRKREERA